MISKPPNSRSRITNGRSLFGVNVDARSDTAKRLRDLIEGYTTFLGDNLSLPKQNLVRRLAAHDVALEQLEGDLANKVPVDMGKYATITNGARRLMQELGITPATAQPGSSVDTDLAAYLGEVV